MKDGLKQQEDKEKSETTEDSKSSAEEIVSKEIRSEGVEKDNVDQ